METQRVCSICGKPLAPNAPEGLCPECLLKAGLGTGADLGTETKTSAPHSAFTPPAIAELTAKFPQLEILEFIGQGGMGAVYKARQKQLNRIVALKILPPQAAAGPGFAERFAREARALAKLNHPHIVTLYEFGQADGLFYFLMEFVDGVNLRQLLRASRIAPKEALAIVPQICEALQFAHDEGIVHRDIKPENILLDKKGQVKIADFGVAKIVAEGLTEAAGTTPPSFGELTAAGSALGTPQYMAPEQIKNSAEVDHRADIYSLGVVFYQMLTGELPAGKIEPPSKKVTIDVRLDEIVLRALEKKPELRYQQASDVKTQIETIATTPPDARRRFSRLAIAGGICFLLAALAFAAVLITESQSFRLYREMLGDLNRLDPAFVMERFSRMRSYYHLSETLAIGFAVVAAVLGWVSIAQIRRRAGHLSGLWLAMFDGLFVPLLALAAFLSFPMVESILASRTQRTGPLTRGGFTNRISFELDRMHARFDNLRVSALSNDSFAVTFSGLLGSSGGDKRWSNITGALAAHRVERNRWQFQGNGDLWSVNFDMAAPNLNQLLATPPLSVTAVAARKGDINVVIYALGQVESSNVVRFQISEDYVQQVVGKFDAGQKFAVEAFDRLNVKEFGRGTLIGVDNQIDVNTGTLRCRANLVPENGQLMIPGLFLNIRLILETKHDVVLVPNSAVQRDSQSAYVWIINSDQEVNRRPVKTGAVENDIVEIQDGLAPGEIIVTDDFNRLEEGAKVRVQTTNGLAAPQDLKARRILESQLEEAKLELARVEQLAKVGLGGNMDVAVAEGNAEILRAEVGGDAVQVAKAKVNKAQRLLQLQQVLYEQGLMSAAEIERARRELADAEAELLAAQAAAHGAMPSQGSENGN